MTLTSQFENCLKYFISSSLAIFLLLGVNTAADEFDLDLKTIAEIAPPVGSVISLDNLEQFEQLLDDCCQIPFVNESFVGGQSQLLSQSLAARSPSQTKVLSGVNRDFCL